MGLEDDENDRSYEFVFGFGSIMNSSTHAAWLPDNDSSASSSPKALPGKSVRIKREFGYERRWNFRPTTGFTALGVTRVDPGTSTSSTPNMNGVLFQVPCEMMPGFDRREVGYDKVQIPLKHIEFCDGDSKQANFELTKQDLYFQENID